MAGVTFGNRKPLVPWLVEMDQVMGWHEVRDREKLSAWLRSDGKTLGDPSRLPWCGDAMDTALHRALPDEPRPGDLGKNPYWALNWMFLGKQAPPCYGAIFVFKRPSGGHVGIGIGQDDDAYLIAGGNQGDSVSRVWIEKKRCVAIRWPLNYHNPRAPLPLLGRDGQPLSKDEA